MTASSRSLRILVSGATGVIGRRIVPLLLSEGHTVSALTRHPANATRAYRRSIGRGGPV